MIMSGLKAFLAIMTLCAADPGKQVRIESGVVQGKVEQVLGKEIYSFLGVPYGASTANEMRFRPPLKVTPWEGVKETTQLASACYQTKDTAFPGFWGSEMWNPNTPMSEDCLQLNMWVPKNDGNNLLPVMAWIFGGGFFYGSPSLDIYNGKGLAAAGNIILVNINYRVGSFGFLFLDDPEAPGNVGLLDQRLALQWIRDNIRAFGGDPNSVCLFGESAGAASVFAHVVAQQSRNLFQRVIVQSAVLDNPWAMVNSVKAKSRSEEFAKSVHCLTANPSDTVACLRGKTPEELNDAYWNVAVGFMEFPLVIVSKDQAGFFHRDAFDAWRENDMKKNLQMMAGTNADEGSFWTLYYLADYFTREKIIPMNESVYRKTVNEILYVMAETNRKQIANEYKQILTDYSHDVTVLLGDYFFTCDTLRMAAELQKIAGNDLYLYLFNQRISNNPWPIWAGVMHGYELEFVFGLPLTVPTNYSSTDAEFAQQIVELWSSFAVTGKPQLKAGNFNWPKYIKGTKTRAVLAHPKMTMDIVKEESRCNVVLNGRHTQKASTAVSFHLLPTRIAELVLQVDKRRSVKVVKVYGSTRQTEDDEVDRFYQELESAMQRNTTYSQSFRETSMLPSAGKRL